MIIQNTSLSNQSAQPAVRPVSVEISKAVVIAAASETATKPSPEQLHKAVNAINTAMRQASRGLEFSVDPDTKQQIVKMVDMATGEVIRQIPSDETLAIARAIDRFQQGLLLREKA